MFKTVFNCRFIILICELIFSCFHQLMCELCAVEWQQSVRLFHAMYSFLPVYLCVPVVSEVDE